MGEGALLGKGYIELTVDMKGDGPAKIKGQLQDFEKVGQQALANLHTNFKQTFDQMSITSQQATVQWRQDVDKRLQAWKQLEDATRKYNEDLKNRASNEVLDHETQQIHKLREAYSQLDRQVAQGRNTFFNAVGNDAMWHQSMTKTIDTWRSSLKTMETHSSGTGQRIANLIATPVEFAAKGIVHVFEGVWDKVKRGASLAMSGLGLSMAGLVTGGIGAIFFKGFDRLNQIEQVTTKLKFFGRTSEEINGIVRDMAKLADQTGMSFEQLSDKANAFLQAGIKPGNDLRQVMQDVADVSAATGTSIESVSDSFMRMMTGNTQRMTLMLNQWQQNGFNILGILEKTYNTDAAGIQKMMKNHQIGFAEIQRVVEEHLHGISQAMGDTFGGKLRRMWEGLGRIGAAFLQPFFGSASAGLGQVNTWIDKLVDKIKENQPKIVAWVGEIGVKFLETASQVVKGVAALSDAFGHMLHAAGTAAKALGNQELGNSLQTAGDGLTTAATKLDGVSTWFTNQIPKVKGWAANLKEATEVTQAFGEVAATISDTDITIKDNSPEVIERFRKMGAEIEAMPDGKTFKVVPKTAEAAAALNAWRVAQGKQPIYQDILVNVKPGQIGINLPGLTGSVNATGKTPGQTLGSWLRGAQMNQPHVSGTTPAGKDIFGNDVPETVTVGATGFIDSRLPTDATIQKSVGPQGLVQWAEPSTEGEAFIPLAASNRDRSLDIWAQTGRLLGVFDRGGLRETVSDPTPWWWRWLGKRKAWFYHNNELTRAGGYMPSKADVLAQEATLTGMYDQTLPGHIAAPWTTQFSPDASGSAPPGPGQVNPNWRIDTSNASYLPGPGIAWDTNPASSWYQGDQEGPSPTVQAQMGSTMNPAWQMWWQNQYRQGPGNPEPFRWGLNLHPREEDVTRFNRMDRSNPLTEGYGPWWGFAKPFAKGGWFGGSSGKGGWTGGSGASGGYTGVGGIRLWAGQLQRLIKRVFPAIHEIGGYRAHDPYPDHPSGEAIDVMIPGWNTKAGVALGNRIKDFTMMNAGPLHVHYDIWRQHMWYPGKKPQGMENRGSPTQNHFDHVHIRVNPGGGGPDRGGLPRGIGGLRGLSGLDNSVEYSLSVGDPYYLGSAGRRWLPGSLRMLSQLGYARGGFRWKQWGGTPFPVPTPPPTPNVNPLSVMTGNSRLSGSRGLGSATGSVSGTMPGTVKPSGDGTTVTIAGTGPIDLSGVGSGGSLDDGSGDSSSSSGDSSGDNGPYYTPGSVYTPTYFNTDDFLTDPEITPEEAKRLRNASDKIENLNGRLDVANQQLAELKANPKTKPSTIQAKEQEIARLTHDRDNAVDDFNALQQNVLTNKPGKGGRRGDGSGVNPALADNPYYKLMQADKMRNEAYASILPDPGALGDIGIGGLKESFLPPGFSDPQTWGVTQAASGLLNFLGGIMPDPISGGLLSTAGAALSGSGSGMASAIKGMIPRPFGSLEIGSPEDAPGSPGVDQAGNPVAGRHLPIGQVPGQPRQPGPGAGNGNTFIDQSINVKGDSANRISKMAVDDAKAIHAPIVRQTLPRR